LWHVINIEKGDYKRPLFQIMGVEVLTMSFLMFIFVYYLIIKRVLWILS